jgi:pimeloyl-ACP methyl ester carboxylesterase
MDKLLNLIGGIPDLPFARIPSFLLEKNPASREQYLRELEFYSRENWRGREGSFLHVPEAAPEWKVIATGKFMSGTADTIQYPSRYQPQNPLLRGEFSRHHNNLSAYLYLWRHDQKAGRPLVLCVHGFGMGRPRRAQRMFKVERLFEQGYDAALYVIPHHWKRADPPRSQYILNPSFLGLSIESFAQNLHDLHSAVLLLARLGFTRIGLIGASLGGYTAALYASLPAPVNFMFLAVPILDLSGYLKPRQSSFSFPVDAELEARSREALELISPLKLKPVFDVNRIRVVAHAGDRLCDPRITREWIKTWRIPDFIEVPGGHWLHFHRSARGKAWRQWLEKWWGPAPKS